MKKEAKLYTELDVRFMMLDFVGRIIKDMDWEKMSVPKLHPLLNKVLEDYNARNK
jgi:hypothetical protein